MKDYAKARATLEKAMTISEASPDMQDDPAVFVYYAQVMNDGYSDAKKAEEALEKAISISPYHTLALHTLGNLVWNERADAGMAHDLLSRASESDPNNAQILCDLAMVIETAFNDQLGSAALHTRALEIDPGETTVSRRLLSEHRCFCTLTLQYHPESISANQALLFIMTQIISWLTRRREG